MMGFITPLFIAIAGAAVMFPIVFHMIRRSPRGRVLFSSLMFLSSSPPRVTKRSRLEHWPLLLLRALALILLGLAFARPFIFNAATSQQNDDPPAQHIVILLDTSASMQRAGLWDKAQNELMTIINKTKPSDHVALITFDQHIKHIAGFDHWRSLPASQRSASMQKTVATVKPTFAATQLGDALVTAADILSQHTSKEQETNQNAQAARNRIMVISDFQSGSDIKALQAFDWPNQVTVSTIPVNASLQSPLHNATVRFGKTAQQTASRTKQHAFRLQVYNTIESQVENFTLTFPSATTTRANANAAANTDTITVQAYVPPGETRAVTLPQALLNWSGSKVLLTGDDCEFDNATYRVPPHARTIRIAYFGADATTNTQPVTSPASQSQTTPQPKHDSTQPLYFLRNALPSTAKRTITWLEHSSAKTATSLAHANLIVLTSALTPAQQKPVQDAIKSGTTAIIMVRSANMQSTLQAITGLDRIQLTEAQIKDYAMWTDVDMKHPIFTAFRDPRFGDFTKIRFWKHRKITLPRSQTTHTVPHRQSDANGNANSNNGLNPASNSSLTNKSTSITTDIDKTSTNSIRVLARFDADSPALLEVRNGAGRVYVFASGWHPTDSQLALSSKFPPIIHLMLTQATRSHLYDKRYYTALPIDLQWLLPTNNIDVATPTTATSNNTIAITTPTGDVQLLDSESARFEPDRPGVYQATCGDNSLKFSVNIPVKESHTDPMPLDNLHALGVHLETVSNQTAKQQTQAERQLRITELESKQKMWRWLIVSAICVLMLETWLSGALANRASSTTGTTNEQKVETT